MLRQAGGIFSSLRREMLRSGVCRKGLIPTGLRYGAGFGGDAIFPAASVGGV